MSNFSEVKLGKIQRNIMALYEADHTVTDDDAVLLAAYWTTYDGWNEDKGLLYNLVHVTRPESITRRRRELFNKGLIKYSAKREAEIEEAFNNELNQIDHSLENVFGLNPLQGFPMLKKKDRDYCD